MTDHGDHYIGRKLRILDPKALGLGGHCRDKEYRLLTSGVSAYQIDLHLPGSSTGHSVTFEQIDAGHAEYVDKPEHGKHNVGRTIRILNPDKVGIRCAEDTTFEVIGMTEDMYQLPKGRLDLNRGLPWHVKPVWFESGYVEWVEEKKPEHGEHNVGRTIISKIKGTWVVKFWDGTRYLAGNGIVATPTHFRDGDVRWAEEVEGKLEVSEHGGHNVGRTMVFTNGDRHVAASWDGSLYRSDTGRALASPIHFESGKAYWEKKVEEFKKPVGGTDIILASPPHSWSVSRTTPKECQLEHGDHNVGRTIVSESGYEWGVTEWDYKRRLYNCHDGSCEPGAIFADQIGPCKNFNWKEEPSCDKPEHGAHNIGRTLVDASGNRRRVNGWNPTRVHPAYYDTRDDKGYARANIRATDIGEGKAWRWLEDAPASWAEPHGEHNVGRTFHFKHEPGLFTIIEWNEGGRCYIAEDDRGHPDAELEIYASQFDDGSVAWGNGVPATVDGLHRGIVKAELAASYAKLKERERGTGPGWYWGRMNDDDEWQPVKTMTGDFGECWTIGAKLPSINGDGQYDLS